MHVALFRNGRRAVALLVGNALDSLGAVRHWLGEPVARQDTELPGRALPGIGLAKVVGELVRQGFCALEDDVVAHRLPPTPRATGTATATDLLQARVTI